MEFLRGYCGIYPRINTAVFTQYSRHHSIFSSEQRAIRVYAQLIIFPFTLNLEDVGEESNAIWSNINIIDTLIIIHLFGILKNSCIFVIELLLAILPTFYSLSKYYMAEEQKKSWYNSVHKWVYLKIALIYFTSPKRVYEIAHKSRGASIRERMIRARLINNGVLSKEKSNFEEDRVDLESRHL